MFGHNYKFEYIYYVMCKIRYKTYKSSVTQKFKLLKIVFIWGIKKSILIFSLGN